jgi:hypothetical protein
MDPIHYCPICSLHQPDPYAERCPKCRVNLRFEMDRKRRIQEQTVRKAMLVEGPFRAVTGLTCDLCGEAMEVLPRETRDFFHRGKRTGDGPSGPEFALTRARITFQPWRCQRGHMFFSSYQVEWKEVCPRCRDPVNPFTKMVLSCPRCRIMVPSDLYEKGDPVTILEKEGYSSKPSLEPGPEGRN